MLSLPDIRRPFLLLLPLPLSIPHSLLLFGTCHWFGLGLPGSSRVKSSNYAPLFGIFIILRTKRDFSRRELLVIVAPCVMFSVLFFILRCCFSCCDFSLLLFAPLMQNFNFNLIPVVALVVRIVCQLFRSPTRLTRVGGPNCFGNKRVL